MKKILLILLGLPILLWSQDKGDWGEKGFLVPILFFVPFILIYFFFPKLHKFARNIYLILTLSFILLLCIIFIKTMFPEEKQNQPSPSVITDTSNRTVYTNKTFGYSLKFPATYWVPVQTEGEKSQLGVDNNIGVERTSDPRGSSVIVIDVDQNKDDMTLGDYMNKNLKMYEITGPLITYNFNGYDSLFNKNQPGTNVFVKQGQYIYHIIASTASTDKEVGDIVATFKFTNDSTSLNYVSAMSILQNVPEIQLLQKDIIRLGRTTFFEAGDENGDIVKIWLYEDGNPDKHITRIDTFNVNIKTKVITVDDVAMMSGKEFITLEEWKKTIKGRFQ